MTNKQLYRADMLDILFEHRNKKYGAYVLRRNYNQRLGKSLAITLSIFFIAALMLAFSGSTTKGLIPGNDDYYALTPVDLDDKQVEAETRQQTERRRQVRHTNNIRIVPNDLPRDVPLQQDIVDAVIGGEDIDGPPLVDPNEIVRPQVSGNNNAENIPQAESRENPPLPSHGPKFPGGSKAWMNFLLRYLQTPSDLEAGEKVEVKVKFWIDVDGTLSRFEIIQSGGESFDREVLRAMKKMPAWEPAVQNGQKIAVSFTQPVIFVGVEE